MTTTVLSIDDPGSTLNRSGSVVYFGNNLTSIRYTNLDYFFGRDKNGQYWRMNARYDIGALATTDIITAAHMRFVDPSSTDSDPFDTELWVLDGHGSVVDQPVSGIDTFQQDAADNSRMYLGNAHPISRSVKFKVNDPSSVEIRGWNYGDTPTLSVNINLHGTQTDPEGIVGWGESLLSWDGGTETLGEVVFFVYRAGSPGQNVWCEVYKDFRTDKDVDPIAVSDTFLCNLLGTSTTGTQTFTFSGGDQITLTDGDELAFIVRTDANRGPTSTGPHVRVGFNPAPVAFPDGTPPEDFSDSDGHIAVGTNGGFTGSYTVFAENQKVAKFGGNSMTFAHPAFVTGVDVDMGSFGPLVQEWQESTERSDTRGNIMAIHMTGEDAADDEERSCDDVQLVLEHRAPRVYVFQPRSKGFRT